MADFQKLSNDRLYQNIKRSVDGAVGVLVTGDITKGTVVDVTFDASNEESVTVSGRRTGAILVNSTFGATSEVIQELNDTILTVYVTGSPTGTLSFWVF